MKRRELIKKSLVYSGGLWASSFFNLSQALAAEIDTRNEETPSFLVVVSLEGGWTTNLSLDPWTHAHRPAESDIFLEYRADEVEKIGNLFFGPSLQPLKSYADRMNIINGIYMSATDNGHGASEIYITSGDGTGSAGDIAAEFELSTIQPSPLGALFQNSIYAGSKSVYSTSISNLSNLSNTLDPEQPFLNPNSPITRALQIKKQNAAKISQFLQMKADLEKQGKTISDSHLMALAYRSGLAQSAKLLIRPQAGNSLDTHSNHPGQHLQRQTDCWQQVKALLDSFKDVEYKNGQSMFDVTTFFITSEFSRTPALDASKGTNHNPMNNSALLIGPSFKGNSIVGESRLVTAEVSPNQKSYLVAQMLDYSTGEVIHNHADARARGGLIKPENVIATLADSLKIQRNIFTAINEEEKSLTSILKT